MADYFVSKSFEPRFCAHCTDRIDLSSYEGAIVVPKNGDFSICAYCATLNVFDDTIEGGMRRVTDEELHEFKVEAPEEYAKIERYQDFYQNKQLKPGDRIVHPPTKERKPNG